MHNEYVNREDETSADTDLSHNFIDTTRLNNALGGLSLFLSAKSVCLTMPEEAGHILILSSKDHAKEAGHFLFSIFCPIFLFLFESMLTRVPKTGLKS